MNYMYVLIAIYNYLYLTRIYTSVFYQCISLYTY